MNAHITEVVLPIPPRCSTYPDGRTDCPECGETWDGPTNTNKRRNEVRTMRENAKYNGQVVKIGTCEDLYYLRYEDRQKVEPMPGSLDPSGDARFVCRFRFPWPDEDGIAAPGMDNEGHDYDRFVAVPGAEVPEGVRHNSVQFKADAGYLCSLPCPESGNTPEGLTIHRNGFAGAVHLCQVKPLKDGRVVPILRCGGCGTKYRLEDTPEIEAIIAAFRSEGDRRKRMGGKAGRRWWWDQVAERIAAHARITEEVGA